MKPLKRTCPHCNSTIQEWTYSFDCLDALLLVRMGWAVKYRQRAGIEFNGANAVHVASMADLTLATRCRTTQVSKLGLIAKFRRQDGTQMPGVWLITSRGWAALRGEPVPKEVSVTQGKITERTEKKITIGQAFQVRREKLDKYKKLHPDKLVDYSSIDETYDPQDWYDIGRVEAPKVLSKTLF